LFSPTARSFFYEIRKYRGTQKGQQIGAILWAVGITGVLKTLANIVLPFFGVYDFLPVQRDIRFAGVTIYATLFPISTFFAAIGARPIPLFPIAYKIALSYRDGGDFSFIIFQNPDCLVGFPRRNDV
jgi:hypothetical protein